MAIQNIAPLGIDDFRSHTLGKGFVSKLLSPVDLEVPQASDQSQKARYPQEENEYRTPRTGPISVVACQLLLLLTAEPC
jgi:hypothetical protein